MCKVRRKLYRNSPYKLKFKIRTPELHQALMHHIMKNQNPIKYTHMCRTLNSISLTHSLPQIITRTEEYQQNNIQFESGHATRLLFHICEQWSNTYIQYIYNQPSMELLNLRTYLQCIGTWWSEVYNFVFSDGQHLS